MPPIRKIEPYIVPAVVVLVGLTAFGLGRLSVIGASEPRLVINAPQQSAGQNPQVAAVAAAGDKAYVASKSGTKYYLPTCSGAARIKEENKVWFGTVEEAEAAGYGPAANCSGL